VNGNSYVGSSENLTDRFRKYYSFGNISLELLKGKSLIYSAILKYGLKNFQIEILEYCAAENAISREQYYLYLLKPKYNILTTAGSRLGYIHSEEARVKMSNSSKGRKFSEDTKKLLSLAKKGMNNPDFGKTHGKEKRALITLAKLGKSVLSESMKSKMSIDSGTSLRVLDLITNETSVYPSITKAAEGMGVSQAAISKRFKNTTEDTFIIKKRYKVEKVEVNNS
jgi:group I intron endonuclease